MNLIKISRAFKLDDGGYQLNEVLEMNTNAVVINDIAWAPGCIHMRDLIATACDDGCTRVFEVTTPHNKDLMASSSRESPPSSSIKQESSGSPYHTKSGIGAGLENASRVKDFKRGSGTQWIRHEWKQVAKLAHRENLPAWRVQWLYDGSALASTGDSGTLHIWKQNYDGQFVEFAETALRLTEIDA
ncbi:MAG: hypothetical protein Q9214_000070 [Letrouitia sp. 1 TL-2023]